MDLLKVTKNYMTCYSVETAVKTLDAAVFSAAGGGYAAVLKVSDSVPANLGGAADEKLS